MEETDGRTPRGAEPEPNWEEEGLGWLTRLRREKRSKERMFDVFIGCDAIYRLLTLRQDRTQSKLHFHFFYFIFSVVFFSLPKCSRGLAKKLSALWVREVAGSGESGLEIPKHLTGAER